MEKYYEVIDGKQIPTWALKPVDELSDHDVYGRARWVFVCKIAPLLFEEPEEWIEHIKYTLELQEEHKDDPAFINAFIYWISDDYFYEKYKSDVKLDEKMKKAPLSEFTLRQIVNALYVVAYGYLDGKSTDELKKFIKGASEYSKSELRADIPTLVHAHS